MLLVIESFCIDPGGVGIPCVATPTPAGEATPGTVGFELAEPCVPGAYKETKKRVFNIFSVKIYKKVENYYLRYATCLVN